LNNDTPERLQGDPDLFVRIAENAMVVAEEIRQDYFQSTLGIAREMRREFRDGDGRYRIRSVRQEPLPSCSVAFVDGGISKIDVGIAAPLIVRAGIYRVKQGEADLTKRETFGHCPLMLGQLRGGLKAGSRYGDVVRQLVELGALVTALEDQRFSDIRMLMLHGPLQFVSGPFFEHWFFPEDYEAMLGKDERDHVLRVLGQFAAWCSSCELRGSDRCGRDIGDQHLPAVCMMAFLQHYVLKRAAEKGVVVCGVVERSFGRSVTRHVVRQMLEKSPEVFDRLLGVLDMRGRATNTQVDAILDATRYNDAILLALALARGEALEWYPVNPRLKIKDERVALFPDVQNTFVRVTSAKYPMRIEVPAAYGEVECEEVLRRSYEYASLLPGYAFPIGPDIVDKYAAIPGWMTKAYRQLILAEYGRLLSGEFVEMTDTEAIKSMIMMRGSGKRSRKTRPEV
jgi:hypothetical protein